MAPDGAHRSEADTVYISMLGRLRVRVGPMELGPRQLGGAKPRHLLIALALARGAPVSKERLATILWPDVRPVDCAATIDTYVCVLRKRLQASGSTRGGHIETRAGCYSIDVSRVALDTADTGRDISGALHPSMCPEKALPLLRQALALTAVPLLPDEPSVRWLDEARDEHERTNREWLVAAAEKVVLVAPSDAAHWARQAIDADPLDEGAWYAFLHSKEVAGQNAEGLRAYNTCRRLFADELGCAPGPRLQEMYGRLLRDSHDADPDLEHLIEAVVRLHRATRDGRIVGRPALTGSAWPGLSVEQARHALTTLLRGVASTQPRIVRSITA
jgi:DNA-binding SARP family transcriptional activator